MFKPVLVVIFACGSAMAFAATETDRAVQKISDEQTSKINSSASAGKMILESDFEKTALFNGNAENMIGEYNPEGRWGSFSAKGPVVTTEKAHSGKQSIKLIRGGGDFLGYGEGATKSGCNYEAAFWIYRQADGSFSVFLNSENNKEICGIYIWPTPEGELFLYNFASGKWTPTKTRILPEQWMKVRIMSDVANKKYGAVIQDEQKPDTWESLNSEDGARGIKFTPAAPDKKVTCYIDDLRLTEIR